MKKGNLLLLLAVLTMSFLSARADIVIDDKSYHADTLVYRQVGPGMINAVVRLPDYPLNVYVVSVDLNNPHNRVETTFADGIVSCCRMPSSATALPPSGRLPPAMPTSGSLAVTVAPS